MTRAKSTAHLTTAQLGAKRLRTGRTRLEVMTDLCDLLSNGMSLKDACATVTDAPVPSKIIEWLNDDPEGIGELYKHARYSGYQLLADEIVALSDKTYVTIQVHDVDSRGRVKFNKDKTPMLKDVVESLSPESVRHRQLQIDTRKWMLAKMLPKVFGDKLLTEHTGTVNIAAVPIEGVRAELNKMLENNDRGVIDV